MAADPYAVKVQGADTAGTPLQVTIVSAATGGATQFKRISTADTNAANIKASAGTVYSIQCFSIDTALVCYLKLYDKASSPTVGSDTVKKTILIPLNNTGGGAGIVVQFPEGINFTLGISMAITGAITDADTTVINANKVMVNIDYS